MNTNLNIRVISYLKSTKFFTLYQQNINLNAKNLKINAWQKSYITPGAQFYTVLPKELQVQGMVEKNNSFYRTKATTANYNESYEIYMNNEGIDIHPSCLTSPTDNTMNIYNATDSRLEAVILSNESPIFSASIRPNNKLNFFLIPSIYVAICDYSVEQKYLGAAALSPLTRIDYEGQSYLTISLSENLSTGKFTISYDFNSFDLD